MKFTKNTAQWEKIRKQLLKDIPSIKTGWFQGQNYGSDNDNLPYAQVAFLNEEGHINGAGSAFPGSITPPRPFMRVGLAVAIKAGANKDDFKDMIEAVASGKSILIAMQKTTNNFERTLRKVMLDWDTPMNSPKTEELKGFNNPLVETSELIANVTSKVGD